MSDQPIPPRARLFSAIDASDVVTGLGVLLIAIGLWPVWWPGAFIGPGLVCIWYGLPSRPAFIDRIDRKDA